jgi:hypothetical protein
MFQPMMEKLLYIEHLKKNQKLKRNLGALFGLLKGPWKVRFNENDLEKNWPKVK